MKSEETHRLCRGELIRLDGDVAGRVISCREGILWLTQADTPGDHLIQAGEAFLDRPSRPGPDQCPGGFRLRGVGGKEQSFRFSLALFGFPANGAPFRGGDKRPFGLTMGTLLLILPLCLLFRIDTG